MPLNNEDIEDIFDEIDEDAPQASPESNPAQPPQAAADELPFPEPPQADLSEEQTAENFSADLVDDLTEDEEEEQGSEEVNTEESFAPSKEISKTKKTMQITALIVGAAIFLLVVVLPPMMKKEAKKEENAEIVNSDEILKQMREYNENDIKRQQERAPRKEMENAPLPSNSEKQPQQRQQAQQGNPPAAQKRSGSGNGGGAGRNAAKDEEILRQYSEVDPAAASGAHGGGLNKLNALPARKGAGGLNVLGKTGEEKQKVSYYNLELKASLKFGVRSSGGNSVVATIRESKGDFPEGTIFYGHATFNNKRTFIQFTHAQTGETKIALDGRAMTGKDPGLPSEVTEIAGQNADSSLKSGAIGVAGKVADNALSNVTQGVTKGVLSEPTKDLQKEQEEQKKQYEYYVPAGTLFTIYVY